MTIAAMCTVLRVDPLTARRRLLPAEEGRVIATLYGDLATFVRSLLVCVEVIGKIPSVSAPR